MIWVETAQGKGRAQASRDEGNRGLKNATESEWGDVFGLSV